MKKVLKHFARVNTILLIGYTLVYLVAAFIRWDFFFPFQWLMDIPKKGPEYRSGVLATWVTISLGTHFYTWLGYSMYKDRKSEKN